jgi:hypothetical protein
MLSKIKELNAAKIEYKIRFPSELKRVRTVENTVSEFLYG